MTERLLWLLAPELTLTVGACVVLLIGLARSETVRSCAGLISFLTVLGALSLAWSAGLPDRPIASLGIRLTSLACYVRLVALGIGLVVLLVHAHLPQPDERSELFSMILFSLTGILLTALADDLVLLFLAIELVSVPTYVLVSIGRSNILAQEAGVKYFFLGALAAALLAYGFSFLYGAAGTTVLSRMSLDGTAAYATIGLLLAFSGIAFKIVAVPFHAYVADVYQGAASPVTGLLGFFPKVAGFVALIKLLLILQTRGPGLIGWDISNIGFVFLWLVAAATMTVGNVLALLQSNVKRILAYSSIAHSGYMLVAVLVGPVTSGGPLRNGLSAMLFYIAVYGAMNLGAFAVLSLLRARGREVEELDDLAGLSQHQPLAALALAVCVFSLMGMPPTAGFLGKLYIFGSALSAGPAHPHHLALIVLAIVGVINTAVAAAYYLRIVAACYFRAPTEEIALQPRSRPLQVGLLCCCLAVLFIGLWPQPLIRMTRQPSYDLPTSGTLVENAPRQ
jgi:NADH-quinone oxidoreductase subunit N